MTAVGLALLLAVLYLVHGSFEMFPTEEQQGKVRIVMSVVVVCLVAAEALLWGFLRYARRREQSNSSVQSGSTGR
jgi:cytoskeletal protein RodZ